MAHLDALAEMITAISHDDFSKALMEKTELHVFDALGAMLGGRHCAEAGATINLVRKIASGAEDRGSAGLVFDSQLPLPQAVMLACICVRITEADDIDLMSCTTPGAVVVPTALLCASFSGASGKKCLEAIVAGYEVMTRLGTAVKGAHIVYGNIWPTYLCAAACAAATGAKIFGWSQHQIKEALAISLTLSSGLSGSITSGVSSRWLTLGCAVQNGILAALAAGEGFAGDENILDGPFSSVFGLDLNPGILLESSRESFHIERISLKPYCTARQTLSPLEAFRTLIRDHHIAPESIDSIEVIVPDPYRSMIDRPRFPENRLSSIVGVQYQMAIAAFYKADLYDLHRDKLRDEKKIRAFMKKIRVKTATDLTAVYPEKWPGKTICTVSGKCFEMEVDSPLGSVGRPMHMEDSIEKIKNLTRDGTAPEYIEKLAEAVRKMRHLSKIDTIIEQIPFP